MAAGGGAIAVACDLSDRDAVTALCERVERSGPATSTSWFLNAGVIVPGDVVDLAARDLRLQLDVMLGSVAELAAAAARAMLPRGRGHVVATRCRWAGSCRCPASAAYSAAKAGLRAYLAALRTELRGTGVAVSGIYPSGRRDHADAAARGDRTTGLLNFFGKVSSAEDVADVFERAQRRRRLEHFLPYGDSILCRVPRVLPVAGAADARPGRGGSAAAAAGSTCSARESRRSRGPGRAGAPPPSGGRTASGRPRPRRAGPRSAARSRDVEAPQELEQLGGLAGGRRDGRDEPVVEVHDLRTIARWRSPGSTDGKFVAAKSSVNTIGSTASDAGPWRCASGSAARRRTSR
jgi:short-subunit dehydrogenase